GIKWMRIRLGALSVSAAGIILPRKAAAPSLTFSSTPESFSPDFTVIPLDPLSAGFFAVAAVRCEEAETGAGRLMARTYQLSSGRLAARKYRPALRPRKVITPPFVRRIVACSPVR